MENGDRGGFPSEAQLIPAQDGGRGSSAEGQRSGAEALTGCFAGTCALWNGVEAPGAQAASPWEGHSLQRLNGPVGPYN